MIVCRWAHWFDKMTGIFDSHAHYDDDAFAEDRAEVLGSLPEKGVCGVVNVGCDVASSKVCISLAEQYSFVYAAVGIHPQAAGEATDADFSAIEALTQQKKVVAVGEIGLDYYYDTCPKEIQQEVFARQLALANKLDLPVIIHSREATADTLALLRKYRPKGVMHCFSSSAETAKEVVALGLYLGFTGVVTFKNVRKQLEALQGIPADRILLETDCPYMAPVPHRGKRCTSDMIALTAEAVAQVKGVSPQEMIDIARENTLRLFRISGV